MIKNRGLELELPDQEINRGTIFLTDQKINSAPSTETPLYIKYTLKVASSQGGNFREFPTSVKEVFSESNQPQDKWYRTAVIATTAAVGAGLTLGLASLLNPQSPSLIRTAMNLIGRIP